MKKLILVLVLLLTLSWLSALHKEAPPANLWFLQHMYRMGYEVTVVQEPDTKLWLEPRKYYIKVVIGGIYMEGEGETMEQAIGQILATHIEYLGVYKDRLPRQLPHDSNRR